MLTKLLLPVYLSPVQVVDLGGFVKRSRAVVGGIGLAIAGVIVSSSPALAVPPPPGAGQCGAYFTINVTDAATATVRECRPNSTTIYVNGTVTDKKSDGLCAQVYASYNVYTGTDYGPKACPKGQVQTFQLPTRAGTDAFIYLRTV